MPKFRKKPVVIEAYQFNGSSSVVGALLRWMEGEEYVHPAIQTADITSMWIETLEGELRVSPGDYVIMGVQGEFYPCKPDIFAQTYEEVA